MNKKVLLTIGLAIIIALSFLLFFGIGNSNKDEIQISTFAFVILGEIITYGVGYNLLTKKDNTFLVTGMSSLTAIYLGILLIMDVLLKNIFSTLKGVLVFNFSILLIYALITTIIIFFMKEKK